MELYGISKRLVIDIPDYPTAWSEDTFRRVFERIDLKAIGAML